MAGIYLIRRRWKNSDSSTRALAAEPAAGARRLRMKEPESSTRPQCAEGQTGIEVSAGLVFRDGKLLITQRFADSHLGGLWEFPGGKRETNETFEQCLVRELREELGIEVEVLDLVQTITHAY